MANKRTKPRGRPEQHAELMNFIDQFSVVAESAGMARTTGRVMGYLMVLEDEKISSTELAGALGLSAGSISTATRFLVNMGFVRRVQVPGDRSHYFVAAEDMWGSFLTSEHTYIARHRQFFTEANGRLAPQLGEHGRERLENGLRYMTWLDGLHQRIYEDWQRFRKAESKGR